MRVLLIGGGGREDALAWAITRSPRLDLLRCAPGNAGIAERAKCVQLPASDVDGLVGHAVAERYDLVVVGPEAPLVAGLADRLRERGLNVFGPEAGAARLEGSKAFAKEFMERHGIPTAAYRLVSDIDEATRYLAAKDTRYPLVLKADGLAGGKGVFLVDTRDEAVAIARELLVDRRLGPAGSTLVVEQHLFGREVSFFALTDGEACVELATCQDYKRALDCDRGANTGGMGTYSPSAFLTDEDRRRILTEIVQPTIAGLRTEGHPYRGVLFVGVMLTDEGPRVLEYNARFGDPETQVLLPRLDGDWLQVLHACATGALDEVRLAWRTEAAVCVVLAAEGYPGAYDKGQRISGVEALADRENVIVFHAGTARDDAGLLVTAGGRVLGVTALGSSLATARERAYAAAGSIQWNGCRYRSDIAADALAAPTTVPSSEDRT